MLRFLQCVLIGAILLPALANGQNHLPHLPAGAVVICIDTPYLRKGMILDYNSDFIRFKTREKGKDTLLQLNATQIQNFTLLRDQIRFEVWPINAARTEIVRIQNKFGYLQLARTIHENHEWLIRKDTLFPILLNQNNYSSILDSLSEKNSYAKQFLSHVPLKGNSLERYLNYVVRDKKNAFSHLKFGLTVGYNKESVNLKKIIGRSFIESADKTYGQRYQLGAWIELPFGTINEFSFLASAIVLSDDQAFLYPNDQAGIRSGLSVKSYYLELPLMANAQLPPLSSQHHWYTFFRGGFVFRQRLTAQVRQYRVVHIKEGISELQFSDVQLGSGTDFGLSTALALTHPLSKNTTLDVSLRYLYFLQRDIYTSHLRFALALGFGK